jgi:CxxC motif-containing protein (DUF1111 family)
MQSRKLAILLAFAFVQPLAAQRIRLVGPTQPNAGEPLPSLTAAQLADFNDGRTDFLEVEHAQDGLGPVFNGRSCAECHSQPIVGGASRRVVTRFGARNGATFDPLTSLGGSLIQEHGIGPREGSPHTFMGETVPAAANVIARRRTTSLFGLGFVDATSDADFFALAQLQSARRRDGIAGRVSMADNISAGMQTVGKFGWKAQVPTLFQFAGDAYLNEMGITNPQFPNENCPNGNCAELAFNPRPDLNDTGDGVAKLASYMIMLAPPPRAAITADANQGEAIFQTAGCDECHVATLHTGTNAVTALDHRAYHPYSDFLLHDMGTLGDGIEQGSARGRDMRTAPLWGLRFLNNYLHDGRAQTLDQAVLQHDGEARASRDRFAAMSESDKAKLRAFLRSL